MLEARGREPRAQFSPQPSLRASPGSDRCSLSLFAAESSAYFSEPGPPWRSRLTASRRRRRPTHSSRKGPHRGAQRTVKCSPTSSTHAFRAPPFPGRRSRPVRAGPAASGVRPRAASRSAATPGQLAASSTRRAEPRRSARVVMYVGYKFNDSIVFNSGSSTSTRRRRKASSNRGRLGRVRDARLLLARLGERARRPHADPDGLHQPAARGPVFSRRVPPAGRNPADSATWAEQRGHLRLKSESRSTTRSPR